MMVGAAECLPLGERRSNQAVAISIRVHRTPLPEELMQVSDRAMGILQIVYSLRVARLDPASIDTMGMHSHAASI